MKKLLDKTQLVTITDKLLSYGTDLTRYQHPINFKAIKEGDIDIIKYTQNHGFNIKINEGKILYTAIDHNQIDMVKYVHEQGADLTVDNNEPIKRSIINGNINITKYLHANGANPKEDYLETLKKVEPENAKETIEYLLSTLTLEELKELRKNTNEYKEITPQITKFTKEKERKMIEEINGETEIF